MVLGDLAAVKRMPGRPKKGEARQRLRQDEARNPRRNLPSGGLRHPVSTSFLVTEHAWNAKGLLRRPQVVVVVVLVVLVVLVVVVVVVVVVAVVVVVLVVVVVVAAVVVVVAAAVVVGSRGSRGSPCRSRSQSRSRPRSGSRSQSSAVERVRPVVNMS